MPYIRHALSRRLTRRTCLSCGHQGRELQGVSGVTTVHCPSCGADLYARPPRSYAEMEGLVEVGPDPRRRPSADQAVRRRRAPSGDVESDSMFRARLAAAAAGLLVLLIVAASGAITALLVF